MKRIAIAAALLATACASPTAPTEDPVAAFAAKHAHEVCMLATKAVGGQYVDYGVLVPIETWVNMPTTARVMPISYCNPAE